VGTQVGSARVNVYDGTIGEFIRTFASNSEARGVIISPASNLYVSDTSNDSIKTIQWYDRRVYKCSYFTGFEWIKFSDFGYFKITNLPHPTGSVSSAHKLREFYGTVEWVYTGTFRNADNHHLPSG
jgi:hypothetical protein